MTLKVKKLDPRAKLPTVAHPGEDAGFDLYAIEDVTLTSGNPTLIRTGIAVEFEPGIAGIVKDRSSVAMRGIHVTAGVIDSGYRGEVKVLMTNTIPQYAQHVYAGDKIAQLVAIPVLTSEVEEVTEFTTETARGDKGFGSSGK